RYEARVLAAVQIFESGFNDGEFDGVGLVVIEVLGWADQQSVHHQTHASRHHFAARNSENFNTRRNHEQLRARAPNRSLQQMVCETRSETAMTRGFVIRIEHLYD